MMGYLRRLRKWRSIRRRQRDVRRREFLKGGAALCFGVALTLGCVSAPERVEPLPPADHSFVGWSDRLGPPSCPGVCTQWTVHYTDSGSVFTCWRD